MLPPHRGSAVGNAATAVCHTHAFGIFDTACSALLVGLLIYAAIKNRKHNHQTNKHHDNNLQHRRHDLPHCRPQWKALRGLDGVESVDVDLCKRHATVDGTATPEAVAQAVRLAGFDVKCCKSGFVLIRFQRLFELTAHPVAELGRRYHLHAGAVAENLLDRSRGWGG